MRTEVKPGVFRKTTSMETSPGVHQFVTKESRPVVDKTCRCCGGVFSQQMNTLFMMHNNGRQFVVVGWQCYSCERAGNEQWVTAADKDQQRYRSVEVSEHQSDRKS